MCECCKQVKQLEDELNGKTHQIEVKDRQIEALNSELRLALQMVELMRHRMFGRSSEQVNPDQGTFEKFLAEYDQLNGEVQVAPPEKEKIEYERNKKNADDNRNGRVKIPDHLERVEKILDLPESEKICPVTGEPLIRIGEEITEQLAYAPGKLYVIRYVRPKYASPDRRNGAEVGVKTAPLPDGPIDRCKADESLLSHIIIGKYCDHLPLHRQVQIFQRHGIELPKSSMCDWVRNSAAALEPLYQLLRETVLKSDYVNTDDTPIHFKNERGQGTGKGHMWLYLCRVEKPPDEPLDSLLKKLMFFEFTRNWDHEHPINTLKDFQGYLQSDGFQAYIKIAAREGVTGMLCWAHVRRRFFELAKIKVKDAEYFLLLTNILYRIEHRMEKLKEQGRPEPYIQELREKRANRVMKRFFERAKTIRLKQVPKTPFANALDYALNNEEALKVYPSQLRFSPDNNVSEANIRPLVLGKKNYMLLGNEGGGKTAAVLYSLIASAKACHINPFEYLKDVLAKINSYPHSKLADLLPHNWQPPVQ